MAKEAADDGSSSGESCGPISRRWKELHTKAVTMEGTAHKSYSSRSFRPIRRW